MLMDLSDYFNQNDRIGDHIKSAYSSSSVYTIFPAYKLYGFYSMENLISSDDFYLDNILNTDNYSFGSEVSYNLAQDILCANLPNIVDSDGHVNELQINQILLYAINYGIFPNDQFELYDDSYLYDGSISVYRYMPLEDFSNYRMAYYNSNGEIEFIGVPSLTNSVQLGTPYCQIAVSSDTEYYEQFVSFLNYVLSDDVQLLMLQSGCFPVNDSLMEMYANSITDMNIEDPVFERLISRSCLSFLPDVESDEVQKYLSIYYSVDSFYVQDYSLLAIVQEEVMSFYSEGRPIENIADTLTERLNLYLDEIYN